MPQLLNISSVQYDLSLSLRDCTRESEPDLKSDANTRSKLSEIRYGIQVNDVGVETYGF